MKPESPPPQSAVLPALSYALHIYMMLITIESIGYWRQGTAPGTGEDMFAVGLAFLFGSVTFIVAWRSARRRIARGEYVSGIWGSTIDPLPIKDQTKMRKTYVYWIISNTFLALIGTSYVSGLWSAWSVLFSILASLILTAPIATFLYLHYIHKPEKEAHA